MSSNLINKVRKDIARFGLITAGERILVAVSGGPDSMALLYILYHLREELDLELAVAHYDHHLRKDSTKEALFVKKYAEGLGLPVFIAAAPVRDYAKREKLSLEAAGRELRYRFFERIAKEHGYSKVALAHQADDLAEEVLMRFIRGAGRRGLAGIPVKRGGVFIRPLLLASREEIDAFLEKENIPFVEDPSNFDPRFVRNRVRHLLIPFLEKHFHKNVKECLKRTALLVAEEEEFLGCLALERLAKYGRLEGETFHLSVRRLKAVPLVLRRRMYLEALKAVGVPLFRIRLNHIEQIESLLTGKTRGNINLPGGFIARREPGRIVFKKIPKELIPFEITISGPGEYELPNNIKLKVFYLEKKDCELKEKNTLVLDAEKIDFPLLIRSPRPGDRIRLAGLSGRKKLKKIFWEHGMAHDDRRIWPVVEKDGQIIGIPGLAVAENLAPENGQRALVISFSK
ncbi:tRNA lysidine(34) synthetase TilS [Thermodesulfatator atlanticus]|uniref:tRNA lysidine(34) synthetase TilS n=1 Tax=Thermodesulfatator atlanticus TaxID=501497 RepID=UPI0003B70A84|nr:tRNA lysidine(34) synthetase TilS [Thermodesulfatator atlanticus]